MGKVLELPDEVYATVEDEARRLNIEPAEIVRQAVERMRKPTLSEILQARGRVVNRPREGPSMTERFPLIETRDGSLVSDQIIQDRI